MFGTFENFLRATLVNCPENRFLGGQNFFYPLSARCFMIFRGFLPQIFQYWGHAIQRGRFRLLGKEAGGGGVLIFGQGGGGGSKKRPPPYP